jgi:hypothetical protein
VRPNQCLGGRRLIGVAAVVTLVFAQPAFGASLWDSIVDGAKNTYDKVMGKKSEGESKPAAETKQPDGNEAGTDSTPETPVARDAAPAATATPDTRATQSGAPPAATEEANAPAAADTSGTTPAGDPAAAAPSADDKGILDKSLDVMKGAYDAVNERRRAVVERTYTREAGLWGLGGLYAPLALPFPSSYGLDVYYISAPAWTWEFEYRKSSYDIGVSDINIGSIDEQYFTLQARQFPNRSSFNVIYGLGYRKIEILLARDALELYTEDYSLAYSTAHSYFGKIGVGSHFRLNKRWTFDVDWFTLNVVLDGEVDRSAERYASTEQGRKNVRRAERFMKYYPSMTAFQMRLGILF